MTNSGPGTGPAGRSLLAALDRLITGDVIAVRAVERPGALFQLQGRGHRYRRETIAHLVDANLIKASGDEYGYVLRFTAAGRELLGA